MKHMITMPDAARVQDIFDLTDEICEGKYAEALKGKTVVLFFPASSIRTRVSFEKGIYLLGGQPVLFPSETLDKKEAIKDVCGYLNNWADMVIVRHKNIQLIRTMAEYMRVPVINAMTDVNHPCEVLSDLYALSKMRKDFRQDQYLFVGKRGNIGLAWKEAADALGLSLEQCCGEGYEIEGLRVHHDIYQAVHGKDIICTDPVSAADLPAFRSCQVTKAAMLQANEGAVLNPCPPFYRGEEVSEDAIESEFFVGYEFKKHLLEVQQAIMIDCLKD